MTKKINGKKEENAPAEEATSYKRAWYDYRMAQASLEEAQKSNNQMTIALAKAALDKATPAYKAAAFSPLTDEELMISSTKTVSINSKVEVSNKKKSIRNLIPAVKNWTKNTIEKTKKLFQIADIIIYRKSAKESVEVAKSEQVIEKPKLEISSNIIAKKDSNLLEEICRDIERNLDKKERIVFTSVSKETEDLLLAIKDYFLRILSIGDLVERLPEHFFVKNYPEINGYRVCMQYDSKTVLEFGALSHSKLNAILEFSLQEIVCPRPKIMNDALITILKAKSA